MELFISQSNDPFLNLAFEETLLREKGDAAFLWVNSPCVVIGRNQNPFHEADLAFLEAHGIALVRRLSGGGAVYHDEGNLNYSIVSDSSSTNRAADWALSALGRLGVRARLSGRNDIMVGQMKVGGLAERYDGRYLQHGTLLVDVDMNMLENALRPSSLKLKKHGIASVRSRVANLTCYVKGLDVAHLMTSFEDALGVSPVFAPMHESLLRRADELRDSSWVFGAHGDDGAEFEAIVNGDLYRFSLEVSNGIVQSAIITTDAYRLPDLDEMAKQLEGLALQEIPSWLQRLNG